MFAVSCVPILNIILYGQIEADLVKKKKKNTQESSLLQHLKFFSKLLVSRVQK